ncbi:beta-galactosidase [Bacteroidia bacterium]|nr:beta-galactosidase [Bacteroidia bacterium]
MKNFFIIAGLLICTLSLSAQQSRVTTNFDADWKFALGDHKSASKAGFSDKSWRTLNLPHDWSIEGQNLETEPGGGNVGYFPTGIGWYRKTFDYPGLSSGKLLRIEFDGVYENSEVWINGKYLGKRPYGYSSFSYDLTPSIKAKGNVIAVRVDNSHQPNSRWYSGSGIYRHVRLVETSPMHLEKWGVFSYTKEIAGDKAVLSVKASVENAGSSDLSGVVVKNVLSTQKGVEVATSQSTLNLKAKTKGEVSQEITVSNPALWSLEHPNLYTLTSYILVNGQETDREVSTVGIRTIQYTADKGFLLNGVRVKMKGVNLHHETGPVGTAVPERVWERRIEILKSGGCNAIRTAHNPPAPEFLDLCDQLGMLVMDEAFDEWLQGKRDNSYKLYFAEWHQRDLEAMLLRDRNHPSVVMWSIGNEIPDQGTKAGPALAREMIALCHSLDPTRLVTTGNDNIAAGKNATTEEFLDAFANDITGYNYPDRYRRELLYEVDKVKHPERLVVGTETGGVGGSRGTVGRPARVGATTRRASSLAAQLIDVEQRWKYTLLHDYVIGDFMWTGIDYYGETGWPSRGASSGYLDLCGFKKDGYYFFKSIWMDEPLIHLTSNWNKEGQEGQVIPVVVYTNCNEVELFVNGKSYGVKTFEFPRKGNTDDWITYAPGKVFTSTADLHLAWDVIYEPGEIKVVGKKDGKEYIDRQVTTGAPAKIRLSVDRNTIKALPSDVAHVTVEVLDKDDNLVPYAENLIKFDAGGATIIGVESGNLSDLSSTKASERKAFAGLCLAIVQAKTPGSYTLKATAEGLPPAQIQITAQ